MVSIQRRSSSSPGRSNSNRAYFQLLLSFVSAVFFWLLVRTFDFLPEDGGTKGEGVAAAVSATRRRWDDGGGAALPSARKDVVDKPKGKVPAAVLTSVAAAAGGRGSCPYRSLKDLTEVERHPRATSERHTVDPPKDDNATVTLVCCQTTQGPWSIAVHESWAPLGSRRFLEMVRSGYFNSQPGAAEDEDERHGVPLMRCVPNFLCQFGLAGSKSKRFENALKDDPQWLPAGPNHRRNEQGVKRFQRGYFSYAGGGPNTRDNQLFVALANDGMLGGGSPWEVPWGELVGEYSYQTLEKIYTGYGEKGPKQPRLWESGSLAATKKEFPKLDWILSCEIDDESSSFGGAASTNM
jgi:cyclophilin family peptidyl-prolyl cis-trans isomerase